MAQRMRVVRVSLADYLLGFAERAVFGVLCRCGKHFDMQIGDQVVCLYCGRKPKR